MVGEEEATEFFRRFPLRTKLQSLVATKLRNLDSFSMKEAMLQRVEESFAEDIDIGLGATSTSVKNALFCFIKTAIADKILHGFMDEAFNKNNESWI